MKKILTGLLLATLLLGCMQMSAEDIAKKMEEKYNSIKDMKGTVVVTTSFRGENQIQIVNFAMKKPGKFRSEDENTLTVSDGKTVWTYNKQKNEVVKTELPETPEKPEFDYGKIIKEMLENNKVELLGEEKIANRDCYIIEVRPKNESYYIKQKLWIDKEFWYPLRMEIYYGKFNSTIEYKDVEFNTGISDKEFEFVVPEGAKVTERKFKRQEKLTVEEAQKQVNFTIVTPEYTAGYEFSHAMVFKSGKKELVSLLYKKGDDIMTISESTADKTMPLPNSTKVRIKDKEGEIADVFDMRMLKFNSNGIEIVISGKLSKEELIKIAESMINF